MRSSPKNKIKKRTFLLLCWVTQTFISLVIFCFRAQHRLSRAILAKSIFCCCCCFLNPCSDFSLSAVLLLLFVAERQSRRRRHDCERSPCRDAAAEAQAEQKREKKGLPAQCARRIFTKPLIDFSTSLSPSPSPSLVPSYSYL